MSCTAEEQTCDTWRVGPTGDFSYPSPNEEDPANPVNQVPRGTENKETDSSPDVGKMSSL